MSQYTITNEFRTIGDEDRLTRIAVVDVRGANTAQRRVQIRCFEVCRNVLRLPSADWYRQRPQVLVRKPNCQELSAGLEPSSDGIFVPGQRCAASGTSDQDLV